MFTMPGLPTAEKYAELRQQRELELARRRREEKLIIETMSGTSSVSLRKSPAANRKLSSNTKIARSDEDSEDDTKNSSFFRTDNLGFRSPFSRKEPKPKTLTAVSINKSSGTGWGPVQVTMGSSPDPMVQQMEIIKGYIRQARQEKRYDEVRLFEQNLKELELEYMRLRQPR